MAAKNGTTKKIKTIKIIACNKWIMFLEHELVPKIIL